MKLLLEADTKRKKVYVIIRYHKKKLKVLMADGDKEIDMDEKEVRSILKEAFGKKGAKKVYKELDVLNELIY